MEKLNNNLIIKTYTDAYLYNKYPAYTKILMDAITKDPIIDKKSESFKDVVYEIKRARVSDSLMTILNSDNVVLLDCDNPLPRAFKVFAAKDFKSPDKKLKIFIDCTNVITKSKTSSDYIINESKLISFLINAGFTMIYHKAANKLFSKDNLIVEATTCFSKLFTQIIDYLLKISIQESSKIRVLYISSIYFLRGILKYDENRSKNIAQKIADISDRECTILDVLIDKAANPKGSKETIDPFSDINIFIKSLRDILHFNPKAISTDIVVERWMQMYGPSTVMGLEYFPALSAMMTDAYIGAFLNSQKTIETVCKTSMVSYSKLVLNLIESII